jgi:hypothetical protein
MTHAQALAPIGARLRQFTDAQIGEKYYGCEMYANTRTSRKLVMPPMVSEARTREIAAAIEREFNGEVKAVVVRIIEPAQTPSGIESPKKYALTVKLVADRLPPKRQKCQK